MYHRADTAGKLFLGVVVWFDLFGYSNVFFAPQSYVDLPFMFFLDMATRDACSSSRTASASAPGDRIFLPFIFFTFWSRYCT